MAPTTPQKPIIFPPFILRCTEIANQKYCSIYFVIFQVDFLLYFHNVMLEFIKEIRLIDIGNTVQKNTSDAIFTRWKI